VPEVFVTGARLLGGERTLMMPAWLRCGYLTFTIFAGLIPVSAYEVYRCSPLTKGCCETHLPGHLTEEN